MKSPTPTKPTIDSLIDDFDDNLTVLNPDDKEYEGLKKGFKEELLQLVLDEVEKLKKKIDIEIPDTLHRNVGYNQALDDVSQRAKEVFEK